ncbi:MAG: hypothetical protein HON90_15140 [Halobacteriovoraceae bacterium]|jgi:hypothetical protein|nr:hypothetical protein [Halobacteriovoraceae bacterium]
MKLLILLTLVSCTQKYQTYHVIDKFNFDQDNPQTPITKKQYPGRKTTIDHCAGQFFFMSNAKKQTDRYLKTAVRTMCPNSNTILNSRLTETWWTTIIYSRSCFELEGYCPKKLAH